MQKKCSFFHGNFYIVGTRIASAQRFVKTPTALHGKVGTGEIVADERSGAHCRRPEVGESLHYKYELGASSESRWITLWLDRVL